MSDFTSGTPSFCQVLPQEPRVSVRFYFRRTQVSFYLRNPKFLSDFTSGAPTFCQILPQEPHVSVRFYLRSP